jgi:hypothetical protein
MPRLLAVLCASYGQDALTRSCSRDFMSCIRRYGSIPGRCILHIESHR